MCDIRLISLTIALSVCEFASYGTKDLVTRGDRYSIIVNNLRKQLMQENYDYSVESNETQTVKMRADIKLDRYNSKDDFNKTLNLKNSSDVNNVSSQRKHIVAEFDYFSRSNIIDESQMSDEKDMGKIYKIPVEHPISVKDLMYYIDDEKLLKDKLGPETREMNAKRSMNYNANDKKYKLLKVRHQFRRNSPGRFIQEEGNNGVVIINLDNGTLPEFRLPRSRRQYMHDHGEVVAEEEEIPPPPLISSFVAGAIVENATFQNIDFVEIVKEDLRKNNEDYGEIKYDNKLNLATKGYNGITKRDMTTIKVNNGILKSNRRTNLDSEYDDDDQQKGKSTTKEPQLITNATNKFNPVKEIHRSQPNKKIVKENLPKKLFRVDMKKPLKSQTIKSTTNATHSFQMIDEKIPKFVKKNKIDKFKKFMAKNKGLLNNFLSSKNAIQSQKTVSTKPLRTNDKLNIVMKPRGMWNAIEHFESSQLGNVLHRLSPDMLDMAPAKGGRIHRQRVKGRLCQRQVLVPEGPKYDSEGKWYLPPYNLVVRHPYNVTTPPKFLLPRCCNCCKKSVLGCE